MKKENKFPVVGELDSKESHRAWIERAQASYNTIFTSESPSAGTVGSVSPSRLEGLGIIDFLTSGRANFSPIDPSELAMPPPSLEKLLNFRQLCVETMAPEMAQFIPTEAAIREYGKNIPKIHKLTSQVHY